MSLLQSVLARLTEPRLQGVHVDSDDLIRVHREVLEGKPMLREVFAEFYRLCRELDEEHFSGTGMRVEIGAGVSFFKKTHPDIVTTDVKRAAHLDRVLDAQAMDLGDGSVRALYGINCFHHFPEPKRFFTELQRVLVSGGGAVLIEPYHGPVAGFFYRNMFKTEHFNKGQSSWEGDKDAMGAMTGANQALSYIVFTRDAARFEQEFPGLQIVLQRPIKNYLRYIISGGLNFRSLLPSTAKALLKALEEGLSPLATMLALHHVIVIRKR